MLEILIADDNKEIIELMKPHFEKENYKLLIAYDGQEALDLFHKHNPAIVLLDIMMPRKDGMTVCREIRKISKVPIVMVTAKSEDEDVIMGLDSGADDYIVKPFSPKQVIAKIKAILRRLEIEAEDDKKIIINNLIINMSEYTVKVDDIDKELSKKEIEILYLIAKRPGNVYSRENLLSIIWGYEYFGDVRNIDTHMKRIRSKLGLNDNKYSWDIKTVWGVGYKFEVVKDYEKIN